MLCQSCFNGFHPAAVNGGSRTHQFTADRTLATDVIFKRSAPLRALFQRATELGVLLGGADRTTHLFGRRVPHRYRGKLQTVLDRRNQGQPILRFYYQSCFVKQYEKDDRLLRTETCRNDTHHLGLGRHLEHLPELRERMLTTNTRYLETQAASSRASWMPPAWPCWPSQLR